MELSRQNIVKHGWYLLTHKVAQNTLWQLVSKFFSALTTLFILRLVESHYGNSGFGEYTLIINFVNIFYLVADFGLNAIAVKRMVEHPNEEIKLFRTLFGLRLVTGLALILVAIFVVYLLPHDSGTAYTSEFRLATAILSISILSQSIYLSASAVFQKYLLYGKNAVAVIVGAFVASGTFFLLAKPDVPLLIPLLGYLLGNVVTAVLSIMLLPFSIQEKIIPHFSLSASKSLIIASLPIAATLVLNVVYFKSDSFILGGMISPEGVGIYGLAYKVLDQAIVIPVFFVNALYPILLNQFTYHRDKLYHTLIVSSAALAGTAVILGLGIIVFAPLIIQILSGTSDSVLPLRILAAGLPFFFLSNLFLWLLVTLGKQKYLVGIYGISMIFNISMNILLIPHFSYLASAALTTISEAIVLALTMIYGIYFYQQSRTMETSNTQVPQ